jgi:hypothetical protein
VVSVGEAWLPTRSIRLFHFRNNEQNEEVGVPNVE